MVVIRGRPAYSTDSLVSSGRAGSIESVMAGYRSSSDSWSAGEFSALWLLLASSLWLPVSPSVDCLSSALPVLDVVADVVLVAVDGAGGFANFRETATKTTLCLLSG